jgi:transcriptional regulator with XRE-family HTH domain
MAQKLLGNQIRAARGLLNWTRQDLSDESGISVTSISYFENGKRAPTPEMLNAIVAAFGRFGVSLYYTSSDLIGVELDLRK